VSHGAALVAKFEDLVTAHARLPPGSAAAFDAAAMVLVARTSLIRRMAEDAAVLETLRNSLCEMRYLIDKATAP
jgi:hypothetical protein